MTLEAHEIATLFPRMSSVDREHLRESIAREGQLEEVLLFEGKILDGRHRYEVCRELGVEPRCREFEGTPEEAFFYSVALNLSRRHLTTVQRAAAGAGLKEFQARLMTEDGAAEPAPAEVEPEAADPEPSGDATEPTGDAAEPTSDGAEPAGDGVEVARPASAPAESSAAGAEVGGRAEVGGDAAVGGDPGPDGDAAAAPEPAAPAPKSASGGRRRPSARTINARARELASKRVGVSGRAIEAAAKVKEAAPDVFERMLAGTAGSMPDVRRLSALPEAERRRVHELVDEGIDLKAALKQVAPPAPAADGAVFLGKVTLEPAQAQAFAAILAERGIKRGEAAREALVEWIARHEGALAGQAVGAAG